MGDVTYRDEIVIYRVLSFKTRTARRFLLQLKEELKADLKQEEILIVERDVETLESFGASLAKRRRRWIIHSIRLGDSLSPRCAIHASTLHELAHALSA